AHAGVAIDGDGGWGEEGAGGEEACGGAGVVQVECEDWRSWTPAAGYADDFQLCWCRTGGIGGVADVLNSCAELLDRGEHALGIIRIAEGVAECGGSIRERGEEKGAVGEAFGAGGAE